MVNFDGRIVQFGFGAVGKSFYEKVSLEIRFNENEYFVVSKYADEFAAFIGLGGMAANFVVQEITKENFRWVFGQYLKEGDLLLDFADTVGTRDICDWCAKKNIMYLNTGDADWPQDWLNIFKQHRFIKDIKEKHRHNPQTNRHPIVLQHGNNPGLVSHFVKAGIAYIARTQHRKNRRLKALVKQKRFNEVACALGLKMIHVNDIDLQKIKAEYEDNTLLNTWCIDSFLFELLSEAAMVRGSHEDAALQSQCKFADLQEGFAEFSGLAVENKCRTYYPNGAFEGFLIPHEETVSIAKNLELRHNGEPVYRPTVMFLYAPCHLAQEYLEKAKLNKYPHPDPAKPPDGVHENGQTVIRGYAYPRNAGIVYKENIASGAEYVGVLLMGDHFQPVWVGNRLEPSFLYKNKKRSYWQTPTITPVTMSALAAVCWMIKNKEKGGIYLPDDMDDYKGIIKTAEKYISKTIYQTFDAEIVASALKMDFSAMRAKDLFVV